MTDLCLTCHEVHEPLLALGFIAPDLYAELSAAERAEFQAECDDNFCIIRYPDQTDRFIRVVLDIPIIDHDETLDYGVWVSVSEASFNDYRAHFDGDHEATYFGMICNHHGLRAKHHVLALQRVHPTQRQPPLYRAAPRRASVGTRLHPRHLLRRSPSQSGCLAASLSDGIMLMRISKAA